MPKISDQIPTWINLQDPSACLAAFRTIGAVRVPAVIDPFFATRVFTAAELVFKLSEEEKEVCRRRGVSAGYTPPGVEGVKNGAKDPDRCFWDILSPDREKNIFPGKEPRFQELATELYRTLETFVMRLLEVAYPEVANLAVGGHHLLRFSSYSENNTAQALFPSHVDFGLVTAYLGGSSPGLQGKVGEEWVDINNPIGSVLLGAGTTLKMYDPAVVPFRHQVLGGHGPRLSVALFTEPRAEVLLPNGSTAGEHLQKLVAGIRKD
ncbi:MAG: hypothetical protein A2754_02005 [Candidatus Magasanikbacteria bacterium RIFCSPHIGHO2_01_FULL_47_8]|uniref:Fe2OG dioxygenase domain-containing protein n=1 Tax=Candidatus Magasanikbacteria bacterium RIFCSPHIGHO2_01_FULL_47_8 TaxID=1798673 RepID=A0A1F6ME23_9BACT|nr:MAG: hypothetical protein A2754_02005 [Candidatus Magasanikbacteria bacterium RIFCSPHIGHO2_01_FULL_47_8]